MVGTAPHLTLRWAGGIGWLVAWLGVLFWLGTAPSIRFGVGFLVVAATWPWLPNPTAASWGARLLPLALVLTVGALRLPDILYTWRHPAPGTARPWLWPMVAPVPATTTVRVGPLLIHVPPNDARCGDAPLPCAYCLEEGLEARGATPAAGFRRRAPHRVPVMCLPPGYNPSGQLWP